jgi:hypothetical protein
MELCTGSEKKIHFPKPARYAIVIFKEEDEAPGDACIECPAQVVERITFCKQR